MTIVSEQFSRAASLSIFVISIMVVAAFVPSMATSATVTDSGELRTAIAQDIPDFNIFNLASNSISKITVLSWAFEGLGGIDIDQMAYPRLAEVWVFDESSLALTVNLRQGVVFHDGSPLTADDVVFTYSALRVSTIYSSDLTNAFDQDGDGWLTQAEMQNAVWKIDEYTVGMRMSHPYGQFFTTTLAVPIIPQEVWQNHLTPDGIVDCLWNDPLAATGTGPFRYASGVPDEYRIMEKNYMYWGKDFFTPSGYAAYPPNVDRLHFQVIYSTDAAVLALKGGAIDHIATPLPAAILPSVKGDPGVSVSYLEDNGYFYLAFNEKFRPMNYLPFRLAVSHLVDKEQIVDTFMGGLGTKGTTVLPPYWGAWHNEGVVDFVYDDPKDPTTTIPEDILDLAGFVDANGDGWRDLPDGTAMDEIQILCPPADYDPIRVRTAEAIANNLVAVGIRAEAIPVSFDALVAKMFSMDYQMLILGWSLLQDPVGSVFDIVGPKAALNTWGFWSVDDPNPFYNELWGVNTLADAETQLMADQVLVMEHNARSTFSTAEQMLYTREAQAIIHEAQPLNVLYYRVNALATSNQWTGWVPFLGTLLNMFSLSELQESPADRAYEDAASGVNIGITVPKTILSGDEVYGYALVVDDLGYPVEGAEVILSVEAMSGDPGLGLDKITDTTDGLGRIQFKLSCADEGIGLLTATVAMAPWVDSDSVVVTAKAAVPNTLALSASLDRTIIRPGESALLSLIVTDEFGSPVEGATVSLDQSLVAAGHVDASTVHTDLNGEASMTYYAPSTIGMPNRHLPVSLILSVSKGGYEWTSSAMKDLLIFGDSPPDWAMVRVLGVKTTSLSYDSPATTVTVEVVDDEGTRLPRRMLDVSYSDSAKVADPVLSILTNKKGVAIIPVQVNGLVDSCALKVKVSDHSALSGVSASVTLTYVGLSPPIAELFGGYITFSEPAQYLTPLGAIEATVWAWDSAGNPADVPAALMLSSTPYGTLTWSDDIYWDTTLDYLGVNIVSYADGGNYVASGPMNTPFDEANYWEWYYDMNGYLFWDWGMMTGVQFVGGSYTFLIYGIDVAHLDQVGDIFIVPDGTGYFNPATLNYEIDGMTSIAGEYIVGRSYRAVSVDYEVEDPVMTAYALNFDSTTFTGTVTDENGLPVEGAGMLAYENGITGNRNYGVEPNSGTPRHSAPATTDASGIAHAVVTAVGYPNYGSPQPTAYSLAPVIYVKPTMLGAISIISQSQIFIHPQATKSALSPIWSPQQVGQQVPVTVQVTDASGTPTPDLNVRLLAGAGTTLEYVTTTDDSGQATLMVDTSSIVSSKGGFMPVTVSVGGPAYASSTVRMMVPMQNIMPEVEILAPTEGAVVSGTTVTVRVLANDANGIWGLGLSLDGGPMVSVSGPIGSAAWAVVRNLSGITIGPHVLTATAYDAYNVAGQDVVSFMSVDVSHIVTKLKGAPTLSAVSWIYSPSANGQWTASIKNFGLKSMMLEVYEVTGGGSVKLSSESVSLVVKGKTSGDVIQSRPVSMLAGHDYRIVATPNGVTGTHAIVADIFNP